MKELTIEKVTLDNLKGTQKERDLSMIYFRLLLEDEGLTATDLCNEDLLSSTENKKKEFNWELRKWIKKIEKKEEEYKKVDTIFQGYTTYQKRKSNWGSKEFWVRKERKKLRKGLNQLRRERPHAKSQPHYSNLLSTFYQLGFLKVSKGVGKEKLYKSNPEVIYAFISRYSLSDWEFNLFKKTAGDLIRQNKESLDFDKKVKEVKELSKGKYKLKKAENTAKILIETGTFGRFKQYLQNPKITLDFKQTVRLYLGLSNGFRETERKLPVTSFRPAPDFIVYNEEENIISVKDENEEIRSRRTWSLLLTWFDLDIYLRKNPLLTDEEKEQLLNWFFVHIVAYMDHRKSYKEYRKRMKIDDEKGHISLIDPEFIKSIDGHFLKEFKNWEKKLEDVLKDGWLEKICVM